MKKITVSDFTLRKLSEERSTDLLFREKTAIACAIDNFGADAIELAQIKNEKEDTIIYKTISSAVKNARISIPVGFSKDGIDKAWNSVKDAASPVLQVSVPMSTVTMEYTYHVKEAKMLLKIEELVSYSREKCENVEFVCQDAARANPDFLLSAIEKAVQCGACFVTICYDGGNILPDEFGEMIKSVKGKISVPLYVEVSDELNMAVATAFSALRMGADGVKASVTGKNVLLTEKLADAIALRGEDFGFMSSLKTTEIHRDIKSLLKNIDTSTQITEYNTDTDDIFLDKNSTLSQTCQAIKALGYDLDHEDNGKVYRELLRVCEKKSSVGAKELEAIIASSAMQASSTYHLKSYLITSGNLTNAVASIVLLKDDEEINGVATGDGPIDASFRAIEQCAGYHYELDNFQIQAVTEGKEALGSTLVRLRNNGRLYSGNGLSTDIVGASIRAYVNALNKIVAQEE